MKVFRLMVTDDLPAEGLGVLCYGGTRMGDEPTVLSVFIACILMYTRVYRREMCIADDD